MLLDKAPLTRKNLFNRCGGIHFKSNGMTYRACPWAVWPTSELCPSLDESLLSRISGGPNEPLVSLSNGCTATFYYDLHLGAVARGWSER